MKKNLFFLLLFAVSLIFGQTKQQKIDSLSTLLKETTSDSLLVSYSIDLGILIDTSNPLHAEQLFKNALSILDSSYVYKDRSQQKALAYDCLGIISRRRNNYEQAYAYYLKALDIKKKSEDTSKIGRSYHNIAMLFNSKGDVDKAISYMKKALPLRKNDSLNYAVSLNSYGYFLYRNNALDSALAIWDSAKVYYGNDIRLADVHTNIARMYTLKKEYEKAYVVYQKNLTIYKKHEKLERMANTMRKIATSARRLKKFTIATRYLDSSEVLAKKYGNKKLLSNIYKERYRIAYIQNKATEALDAYKAYRRYKDSIVELNQVDKVTKLELEYEYRQKVLRDSVQQEREKLRLESVASSQRSQKRLFVILFISTILILIGLFIIYFYKRRDSRRNIQKQALETELLNEKVSFLHFKIEHLLADNKMRTDFKKELIERIRDIQSKGNSDNAIHAYQSILVQLKNQIETEKRLNVVSEKSKEFDESFELKLADSFPELTKSEREICHLIYLNLSLKEIMNVRNATLPSIKSARYRVRKKLQVPKGIELELFIQQLF